MRDTHKCTFVHSMHNINSEPSGKLWALGDCDGQCRFISCNKWTTLMRLLVMQRLSMCGSRGSVDELCTFPSILLLTVNRSKKKVFIKKP